MNTPARLFTTVILTVFSASFVSAWAADPETEAVAAIRQGYATINKNLSRYKTVRKELAGFSTEGGGLTVYFEGTAIRKIATKHQGETGRSFEEYYYLDDGFMFVYRKEDTYSEPMSGKVVQTRETRFYFEDGELVRWLDENGKRVPRNDRKWAEQQEQYFNNSKDLQAAARSEKTTIEAGVSY